MELIRKNFKMTGSVDQDILMGNAAVMGNLDRGGWDWSYGYVRDVIFPGAFKGTLKNFLQTGFVPVGHDWKSLSVAYPVKAQEKDNVLYTEAKFHSTPTAQEAKTIVQERLDAGLKVGLSIGFSVDKDGIMYFEDGTKLIQYLDENDVKGREHFDDDEIKKSKKPIRGIHKISELYEYSIVTVPMNQDANATGMKDFSAFKDFETVLSSSCPLDFHLNSVLAAVGGVVSRAEDLVEKSGEEFGRKIAPETFEKLERIQSGIGSLLKSLGNSDPDLSLEVLRGRLRLQSLGGTFDE